MSGAAKGRDDKMVQAEVRIELPPVSEMPVASYANFAAATVSQHEVMITFGQYSPPTDEKELNKLGKPAILIAKPVARVAIPPSLLNPLIDVLTRQRDAMQTDEPTSEGTSE